MPEYRHLDSHIEISAAKMKDMTYSDLGDPYGVAYMIGWNLDINEQGALTYVSLDRPITMTDDDKQLLGVLAKYARSDDWIALQPGEYHAQPVPCTLILFKNNKYTTRETTWAEWCAEIGRTTNTVEVPLPVTLQYANVPMGR